MKTKNGIIANTSMDGIILPTRSSANHIRTPLGVMEIGIGFVQNKEKR